MMQVAEPVDVKFEFEVSLGWYQGQNQSLSDARQVILASFEISTRE